MKLACPKCKHQWEQNLNPGVKTQLQCPSCKRTFITMMKPRPNSSNVQKKPKIVQNPPRYTPQHISPEFGKIYLGILKLAHHNNLLSGQQLESLFHKQNSMATNRDIFEAFVSSNLMNAAEFDAFRMLLENPKIQQLVSVIQVQTKKAPVILPGAGGNYTPKQASLEQTLLDEADDAFPDVSVKKKSKEDIQTLLDVDEEDKAAVFSQVPSKQVNIHSEDVQTLLDDEEQTNNSSQKNSFPSVETNFPPSEVQTLLDDDDD